MWVSVVLAAVATKMMMLKLIFATNSDRRLVCRVKLQIIIIAMEGVGGVEIDDYLLFLYMGRMFGRSSIHQQTRAMDLRILRVVAMMMMMEHNHGTLSL